MGVQILLQTSVSEIVIRLRTVVRRLREVESLQIQKRRLTRLTNGCPFHGAQKDLAEIGCLRKILLAAVGIDPGRNQESSKILQALAVRNIVPKNIHGLGAGLHIDAGFIGRQQAPMQCGRVPLFCATPLFHNFVGHPVIVGFKSIEKISLTGKPVVLEQMMQHHRPAVLIFSSRTVGRYAHPHKPRLQCVRIILETIHREYVRPETAFLRVGRIVVTNTGAISEPRPIRQDKVLK